MRIETTDAAGRINGWLKPIWNSLASDYAPRQVYVTTIEPGMYKGPHLHIKGHRMYSCVRGKVKIVFREAGEYKSYELCTETGTVTVPSGCAAALYNTGIQSAILVVLPTHPWSREDPDEEAVECWNP